MQLICQAQAASVVSTLLVVGGFKAFTFQVHKAQLFLKVQELVAVILLKDFVPKFY